MRRLIPRLLLALALAWAAALPVPAAAAGGAGKVAKLWNPATVATVAGTVETVERVEMGEDWRCVRLRLRTAEGALLVRVGPDWFLQERRIVFAAGEKVEVRGSRVTFSGEPAIVAGGIVRGAERILLRDPAGKAAW